MSIGGMTRLLVLCMRPLQLAPEEADSWLKRQLAEVLDDGAVARIHITSVASASLAWARPCDYLIEFDLRTGADANGLVRAPACAALLGDLRLLGMRPMVLVADDQRMVDVPEDGA